MEIFTHPDFDGHEQLVFSQNRSAGLKAIIAIHDTGRGPALGGCRVWRYGSEGEAVGDVLRLSMGMSYKSALADLPLGGGKSVILATPEIPDRGALMRAMGRAVERLGGRYIVAEDVGTSPEDMDEIAKETGHVAGLSSGVGDPSPWTAKGVFLALERAVRHRYGTDLDGMRVAVSGLGHVGAHLCRLLADAGAELIVADIRAEAVETVVARHGALSVAPEAVHRTEAEVFAPCALGSVLTAETIPEIAARIVCGAANNQLAEPEDDARLAAQGVLYCPDYLVNAGGLISVSRTKTGLSDEAARAKLDGIPETLAEIFTMAESEGIPPGRAADRIARARFRPGPL